MQRSILETFTRIAINTNTYTIFTITNSHNHISVRFNSTIKNLIKQIKELPIYNINKLSTREINSWEKLTSAILDITTSTKTSDISGKSERLEESDDKASTENSFTITNITDLTDKNNKNTTLSEDKEVFDMSLSKVFKKESVMVRHVDYLHLLDRLCDKGYNDKKFFNHFISNLRTKFDKIRTPELLTHLLLVLSRCKVKFKPITRNCTKSLDHEMESRIGKVFLDKNYIQQFIKNLIRYMHVTGHIDSMLFSSIFELILDGYSNVPPATLVDILYNLSACYSTNKKMIDLLCYHEHNINTPKQHFLVPISRYLHKHDLRPIDKAKLFRCYVLFDFDHITFINNLLGEVTERLKKSIGFEDFDHHSCEYLLGFTMDMDDYTKGQVLMIADSLLLSRRHHFTRYYKELVQSIYFNCLDQKQIEKLDPIELRCAMSIIGNSPKYIIPDQELLCNMTKRMVDHLECNRIDINDLAIFLKDLVRCTRIKFVRKNERNRTIRITKFNHLPWITQSTDNEKSFLERISKQLTLDTDIVDLTHCLRSIAYLGYNNKSYYAQFLDHFKENAHKLPTKSIAYIEQTLNKIRLTDKHLFYMLGKRFQEAQLAAAGPDQKILLRRIG
ncbi:conserved Plasmodium protein, unknown function [Babesia microti strain RI]|uniref:Uncharacterized protein n=1 Tax=Babesia microti (strain RI) TaxID=1133968 RepID=A0A1N6LXL5_BABMR|nr:conserved Plasmodium protein, unknown function [Babesia microti strain RI]SIO73601.1 conserved Plasmodium protein, unknown function [Babesia microti strain RI]|eukprot:XP_021337685.1 conserved Plasmodium protein, unknown function [Babesia microti strain RI]